MKLRVLIGYNFILHYRIPLFNKLAERYDLTVLHSGNKQNSENISFKILDVPIRKYGKFYYQSEFLREVNSNKYDVVIALFDVAWITTLISIFFHNKKVKFILWGAWITNNVFANLLRLFLTKRTDASIFYTNSARIEFEKRGIDKNKCFVANNTFDVGGQIESFKNPNKDRILFVGSIDKRKQLDVLGHALKDILPQISENIMFSIIGDGKELDNIKILFENLGITSRVEYCGVINDILLLKEYYKRAIVNVSYGQAGLSVLQSLGYGVPFLTKENAISGGEITNIKHLHNSILCKENVNDLSKYLLILCNDIEFARKLGRNAFEYYQFFCTMNNMTQGFIDAIENTRFTNIDLNK